MNSHNSSEAEKRYNTWLKDDCIDEQTRLELKSIFGNPQEIEDRFYKDLEFGTGGLRGVTGAGTNRINIYTIGRSTQGLAEYIKSKTAVSHSAVIAYDSRHQSPEFALEAALVLAGNGIKACVFESLRPTPELSFAVRLLNASAGIVITASHNPPEYNGYKVYGSDGGQLVPQDAEEVIRYIGGIDAFGRVQKISKEQAEARNLLVWIGEDVDQQYINKVASISCNPQTIQEIGSDFRIVYTPLHGAGNLSVRNVLRKVGFQQVEIVAEQEKPDPDFSTVQSPNPEEKEAFTLAIEAAKANGADIIIGTDPDCDRMGAVVRNTAGDYVVLTGNQSGALMVHYLLSSLQQHGNLPEKGVIIKTIVTSEMGAVIAEDYGIKTLNTLTGFKYIGEKISEFEKTGQYQFVFGYEESYGYLAGTYARDKDAVVAAMLICEAAAYYKSEGKTLYEVLLELYESYGYFIERLESRTLRGKEGVAAIQAIMEDWRSEPPVEINDLKVKSVRDYGQGLDGFPRENALKYTLEDGSWVCLRPSGTEPKIKVYFAVRGTSAQAAANKAEGLIRSVMSRVDNHA